jgi:two-component system, cell cycle response regulator DivK
VYRILLVEDNPLNRKLATVILNAAGYDVVQAADSVEAERSIEERVPDLILLDLGLPGKDGYTLARELRRRADTSRVPVLALTSFAMKGDRERAMKSGCTGYLTKPLDRTALLAKIQILLRDDPGAHRRGAPAPEAAGGGP